MKKSKINIFLVVILGLLLSSVTYCYGKELSNEEQLKNKVDIVVNGDILNTFDENQNIDLPAFIYNNRTFLPLRKTMSIFGLENSTQWNGADKSISITDERGKYIWLQIDNKKVFINGKEIEIDVPAKIFNNRTYVPVRFISETMDIIPEWDAEKRQVIVNDSNKSGLEIGSEYFLNYDDAVVQDNHWIYLSKNSPTKYFQVSKEDSDFWSVIKTTAEENGFQVSSFEMKMMEEKGRIAMVKYKDYSGDFYNHIAVSENNSNILIWKMFDITEEEALKIIKNTME